MIIVSDLECTCDINDWNKENPMEIIELAAAMCDEEWNIVKCFDAFIQPVLNPSLSDFCKKLTGITQEDINQAKDFKAVMFDFKLWKDVISEEQILASWGYFDKKILQENCSLHSEKYPFSDKHINLKNLVSQKVGIKKNRGLMNVAEKIGAKVSQPHHRAIHDVLTTVNICKKANFRVKE